MQKKLLIIFNVLILTFMLLSSSLIINANEARALKAKTEAFGATYEATQNVTTQDLGYGITYQKDLGQSLAHNLNNYDSCGPKDTLVGQQINVLNIPSNEAVRVIDWTYMTTDGWTKQTVANMAKNFELHNPGWKVIAGVNADFFDINGNGALPYQPTGYTVSNGEVYRPYAGGISSTAIGFKNDGSAYPFVGGKVCQCGSLKLQVLDLQNNIIKEFDVNKINVAVNTSEIGVWFTYPVMNATTGRDNVIISSPETNSYIIKNPIRCLAMSQTQVYAKGIPTIFNEKMDLHLGQIAIETDNQSVTPYLNGDYMIRVQQNIIGDYADCDNILGSGAQLVKDGKAALDEGGMSIDRHPRTCVGVKEDGSIFLMTVDGRQFEKNMYGMSYAELSATLLYYDCYEGYNVDGGGSTTMIIRNPYGGFDTVNSPSDGNERYDSNSILVVVPEISLDIENVTDTSVELSYKNASSDVKMTNLKLSINNEEKLINGNYISWNNLKPKTTYNLKYTYDIAYKSSVINGMKGNVTFTTGKCMPILESYYYEEVGNDYVFHYKVNDPDKCVEALWLTYDGDTFDIYYQSFATVKIPKASITNVDSLKVFLQYNLQSKPNFSNRFSYPMQSMKTHNFTYNYDGGSSSANNPTTLDASLMPYTLETPSKLGYTFEGWYDQNNNMITKLTNDLPENTTLTAKWNVNSYKVTYELNGGINPSDAILEFTLEELPLTLKTPTKEGYSFIGWNYNGEFLSEITSDYLFDINVTAVWQVQEQKNNETPAKKGCNCKKNVSYIIELSMLTSLLFFIIKKKH